MFIKEGKGWDLNLNEEYEKMINKIKLFPRL